MKKLRIVLLVFSLLMITTVWGKECAAKSQTEKKSYTIVKTDSTPDWTNVPVLQIDNVLWTDDFGIRAQGQLCYSDEALFVHLSAVEKDVRAEYTEPLSPVNEDSCLEFFAEKYFDIHTNRLTDGWEIFYRIPLKFIRLFYPDYQFKGELAANFYKCGDETANKHYLSWSPIDLRSPDFHRPEYFGVITFEEKP